MLASSFSRVKGVGGLRALRDVVGEALVVLSPIPITAKYSESE